MSIKNVELTNKHGVVFGSFRYDPDTPEEYAKRLSLASASFDADALNALAGISTLPDGSPATPDEDTILSNAENVIYQWCDTALGYEGAGKEVFRDVRPFARIKGVFFCQTLLPRVAETIMPNPAVSIWGKLKNFFRR